MCPPPSPRFSESNYGQAYVNASSSVDKAEAEEHNECWTDAQRLLGAFRNLQWIQHFAGGCLCDYQFDGCRFVGGRPEACHISSPFAWVNGRLVCRTGRLLLSLTTHYYKYLRPNIGPRPLPRTPKRGTIDQPRKLNSLFGIPPHSCVSYVEPVGFPLVKRQKTMRARVHGRGWGLVESQGRWGGASCSGLSSVSQGDSEHVHEGLEREGRRSG